MELNAEQIKKALECCHSSTIADCKECPYKGKGDCEEDLCITCLNVLVKDALALINSQEQDKEKLGLLIDELEKEKQELFEENKRLTEENERLKSVEFTCGFVKPHKVLECPIFDEIARTKADTVRKMQTEIKKTFSAICKGEMGDLYRIIDQIAKEMLEGENEN